MKIEAYAKINLALNCLGKLPNGYHDLDMVMVPLALHDDIVIEECEESTYITTDNTSLKCDESNLIYKAYLKVKEKYHLNKNYHFHLVKRIPMQAGLGGGSADAGSVITALLKLNNIAYQDEDIVEMARNLGGDVAFDLFYKSARCRGIGERLDFFNIKKQYYVLLIKPDVGVNTGLSYKKFDEDGNYEPLSNIEELIKGLEQGDDLLIKNNMKNSLQKGSISLAPIIGEIIDELKGYGLDKVMMSGSGSTVFALSDNQEKLIEVSQKIINQDRRKVMLTKILSK